MRALAVMFAPLLIGRCTLLGWFTFDEVGKCTTKHAHSGYDEITGYSIQNSACSQLMRMPLHAVSLCLSSSCERLLFAVLQVEF